MPVQFAMAVTSTGGSDEEADESQNQSSGHVQWKTSIELQPFRPAGSDTGRTSRSAAQPLRPSAGRRGGFSEPIVMSDWNMDETETRCEKVSLRFLQSKFFVVFCQLCLIVSLLGRDFLLVCRIPEDPGDIIFIVFVACTVALYIVELVAAVSLSKWEYVRSPFFIVDVLSIVSIVAEVYALVADILVSNSLGESGHGIFLVPSLRMVCRFKLTKCVSYFNFGVCRLPSWHPSCHKGEGLCKCFLKAFSMRVPLFTIIFLSTLPFMDLDWTGKPMTSMDVWMADLQGAYKDAYQFLETSKENTTDRFNTEVARMEAHNNSSSSFPFSIRGFDEFVVINGITKQIPGQREMSEAPLRGEYTYVEDRQKCAELNPVCEMVRAPEGKIYYNFEQPVRKASGESLLCTIFLLLLIHYCLLEVKWTMREMEDMERFANMSKVYCAPKRMDYSQYETLNLEEKGILQLMGCESTKPRKSMASPAEVNVTSLAAHNAFIQIGKDLIESWKLDVLTISEATKECTLVQYQEHILTYIFYNSQFGSCCRRVRPDLDTFTRFTAQLRAKYNNVPYHGYQHAVDVCHTVYRMVSESKCDQWLGDVEKFTLLVAALGHDVGHFGRTNDFCVKSSHALAIKYNDQSPLENMHCSTLFEICQQDDPNMFKEMDTDDFRSARKLCIGAILHTDMIHHPQMQKSLLILYERTAEICDSQAKNSENLDEEFMEEVLNKEHEFWLTSFFVHVADVSNPTKPFPVCKAWAVRCLDEFWSQGDEEKALGLPIGMLNDREKVSLPGSQHGFINFLVAPVFVGTAKIFQTLLPLAQNMADNMAAWKDVWVQEANPPDADILKRETDIARLRDEVGRLMHRPGGKSKSVESANVRQVLGRKSMAPVHAGRKSMAPVNLSRKKSIFQG